MNYSLDELAKLFVGRCCLFGAIGVLGLDLNFLADPLLQLEVTGLLALGAAIWLTCLGMWAPRIPYTRTGLWRMLNPIERPQPRLAQMVIGDSLKHAYLTFALRSAEAAAGLLAGKLLITVLRQVH